MALMMQLYTADGDLLAELADQARPGVKATTEPEPVQDAASLDLDLAAVVGQMWELTVTFGQLAGALGAVKSIVELLQLRKKKGVVTEVEIFVNGAKITFSGEMTPEETAERIQEFRAAATIGPGKPVSP